MITDRVSDTNHKRNLYSYLDSYSCSPPPIFILSVTITQIASFVYYYQTDGLTNIWTDCAGCFVHHNHTRPGLFIFAPRLSTGVWRFTSYAFLHAGLNHLLGNVIMQLIAGIPLEVVHKLWRIAPIYLLATTTGALLQYAMDPDTILVGASAGVYALIFAHISNVILNWHEMPFRWTRVLILSLYTTVDFVTAIYRRYFVDFSNSVSHLAHIAGAITGSFFGCFVLYNLVERPIEIIIRYICLFLYVSSVTMTIIIILIRNPLL